MQLSLRHYYLPDRGNKIPLTLGKDRSHQSVSKNEPGNVHVTGSQKAPWHLSNTAIPIYRRCAVVAVVVLVVLMMILFPPMPYAN